jgi:hypothetical protein
MLMFLSCCAVRSDCTSLSFSRRLATSSACSVALLLLLLLPLSTAAALPADCCHMYKHHSTVQKRTIVSVSTVCMSMYASVNSQLSYTSTGKVKHYTVALLILL